MKEISTGDKWNQSNVSAVHGSVLIVDKNTTNRETLSLFLRNSGFIVATAEGCNAVLDIIAEQTFDVVLLYLSIPVLNGTEVLKALRKNYSPFELPIIVVTGKKNNTETKDIRELGANDCVNKLVSKNILLACIEMQIALKHKEQTNQKLNQNIDLIVMERTEKHNLSIDRLEQDRRLFDYLLSFSPAITYATSLDVKHCCRFVSSNLYRILGYKPEEMIGTDFWFAHVHPEDKQIIREKIGQNLAQGGGEVEYRFLHNDQTYRWILDLHQVIVENGTATEIVGSMMDITDRKKLMEKIDYKASYDDLTGLINRRAFETRLQQLLEGRWSSTVQHIICYMDLDQFKIINNTYGHVAGDEVLRQISRTLEAILSKRDILAYLGGDEFGILLQKCSLDQAHRVLGKIQDALHEFRFSWEGKKLAITASIGVVPFDKSTGSPVNILSMADAACFAAKEAGRDRIHIHAMDDGLVHRKSEMLWVERINRALEEDRFYLYFQPIVALDDNTNDRHFELLIRMKDENGDILPPGCFLPAAERYNLSSKIDRWVIQTLLSWLETYPELLELEYKWGINLSGHSLADKNLLQFVIEEFDVKQIPPEKIYFEITETAAIANLGNAMEFISTLKGIGCQFALDDFGSGLSSFSYLKNMAVDYVKIDGIFVKDIAKNKTDYAMVKAIHDVALAMDKKTIAEFVENENIIEKLKDIGIHYAQGYGIAKPLPLAEFKNIYLMTCAS